jgi:riboflavin kinase/FMN adenylyltransferase
VTGLRVVLTYPEKSSIARPTVAIGNFDGVHEGHRALLQAARELGGPVIALTFEPHPRSVLRPDVPLKRLMTAGQKIAALQALADVAVVPFDTVVAGWSPADFMQKILVDWLGAARIAVGENFRFGHKASGDVQTLKGNPALVTTVLPLVTDEAGVVFSSSRLRALKP